jgi:superfamily I DNA/RNA helicase
MISSSAWKPVGILTLEPNALSAVLESERSLALTAGPGAGKTEMLAQRADYLLRTGDCRYPRRILAIAFKVDASSNLRERVKLRSGLELAERFDSQTFHSFAKRLIDTFRPVLTGLDALDADYTIGEVRVTRKQITFRDLVPLALEVLRNSSMARTALAQTYSHVFLDEFQDCTNEQYQLVKAAFLGTSALLTAVGDTKQKIMGFAGALEGIFQTFAIDFNAKPLNLYQNRRSKPRLRRMQNEMIKVMDPGAAVPDAELVGGEGEVGLWSFETDEQESEWLARQISHWIVAHELSASEIAVLVANKPECYTQKLMAQLESHGIPYRDERHFQDLGSEPLAGAIIDTLKCVFLDRVPNSYARILDIYEGRWTDSNDAPYSRPFDQYLDTHRRAAFERQQAPTVQNLREIFAGFEALVGRSALTSLSPQYETGPRFDEIQMQVFARLDELIQKGASITEALARFSEDSSVRIMTVHKSKGLEFHTVIALGIEQQMYFGTIDEKRSTFFVQISRAKERLFLTCSTLRPRPVNCSGTWYDNRNPQQEFMHYGVLARDS